MYCSCILNGLVLQLKEMAERNPEEHTTSHTSGLLAGHNSSVRIMLPRESTKAITISPEGESSASSISQTLSHGTKAKTEKAEWVVLDEPGVYITLSSTSGGGTELKRVRFR